jgi:type I restriction enzyme S subunit
MMETELPAGWALAISATIIDVRDGTHDTPKYVDKNGVPLITSKNLKSGELDFEKVSYISQEDYIEISKRSGVEKGDVLFAMIGTIGNPVMISGNEIFSIKNVGLFRKNPEIILSKYLCFFLGSRTFEQQLDARKLLKGTTQKFIPLGNLRDLHIPLPPLAEQHRIVAKIEELFSSLDNGIETLKTAKAQLKVYRQAVLKYAFEGRLTNPNLQVGELPEGWVHTTLGQVAIKSSEKEYPDKNSKYEFLGMDSIEPNTTKPILWYKFSEMKSAGNKFKANQVLYGRMRPYLNKTYLADRDGVASGEFIVFDCKDILPLYLLNIIHHRDFVEFANGKTTGDRPRVSYDELVDYDILLPTPGEQSLIIEEIESRLSVCDKIEECIEQSLQQAEALRQSILKKAFEGKLVLQNPKDEPASILLERIKSEREKSKPQKAIKVVKTKAKKEKV